MNNKKKNISGKKENVLVINMKCESENDMDHNFMKSELVHFFTKFEKYFASRDRKTLIRYAIQDCNIRKSNKL